ncbi:uncharacterized protein F4822DRAFT_316300 [Hypoxylon trugodes]|uniref:uncharacterized protein n=1 Tax=Hypoxylon trugodes TaxID=326681 RepID=UPI00218F359E|nr:uncharacterized protein F4822DRAFT_316300 [Hypoxylon trugodes]KAI1386425.1 hypothetical protein F4822DRAFT_316300 [Hypoxylon trugodes]
MGKSRRNRAKGGKRTDPIAKPAKPPSDPELAAIREKSILPVIKDLQSSEPKSRASAAAAIANIIHDTKCRKLLLREKVVHILLDETLTDASLESRAAGWEILRVLTDEEEVDFCVHLYRIDVLTAIQHACEKVTNTITSRNPAFSKTTKAEQSFNWSIAESLSVILSAVAVAQDEALEAAVRNEQIVRFLFTLITDNSTTAPTLSSALSCMITLSEDNKHFAEIILADNATKVYKQLITFKNGDDYKSVLACAVLHNVFAVAQWNDNTPGKDGACDAVLVPSLSRALENTQPKGNATNGDNSTNSAEILQLALETLASIGTMLQETLIKGSRSRERGRKDHDKDDAMDADDDEQLSDEDLAGEDDEMNQDEIEADLEMVTGDDHGDEVEGVDDLPTLRELMQTAIPQITKLFQSAGNDEISEMIRTHSLTSLNNISWSVSCIDFSDGSSAEILRAWTPVAQTIWSRVVAPILSSDTSDVDLARIVTSLAWALSRTLHRGTTLSGEEHKKFISLYHASKTLNSEEEDPLQNLGVKCIGVLGQYALAAPIALNREIGVFLITIVKGLPETPAADVVEALNQLFDIYGDESKEWDKEIFWKDNFLQHFEEVAPKVKAMVKTIDKRKFAELRVRAEEAYLNLSRFIQYKQKHKP